MKIVLDHLTKRFPNRNRKIREDVVAVDDFTVEIPDGCLIGLLGPSGCGKSTILNLVSGLEEPTSGRIFFEDRDVTNLPPEKRGVGLVFQNYALYPHLTALENIMFPLGNLRGDERLPKDEMHARAVEAAKLVQIDGLLERRPSEMSGGQQQRVAIARALVKKPGVLLLDEPLSNLDARLRLATREEIRRIQRETKITTVFVTHDQEEAMSISDLIVVMKDGRLHQIAKPQAVYDDPVNLFVAKFLGTPPINVFSGTVKAGKLLIGSEPVLDVPGVGDGEVTVGVRPEGFEPVAEDGPSSAKKGGWIPAAGLSFACALDRVEVMGRDTSIVFAHPALDGAFGRAIVDAEEAAGLEPGTVRFALRPSKTRLFDPKTGDRIRIAGSAEA